MPRATGARLPWDKNWTGFGKDLEKDLDPDSNTPDHRYAGAADIEDACGEYRRPLSFQLGLFSQPPLEVHGARSKQEAKILEKSTQKA